MNILIIDNFDSFTFNLFHYLEELIGANDSVDVVRNNKLSLDDIESYDALVLSPGPGLPEDAGICIEAIKEFHSTKKILGVCLGHQAIAIAFGGKLKNLDKVLHGVVRSTIIKEPADIIYHGLPSIIPCGRYHSWVVDAETLPGELEVTAVDNNNEIMSLKHKLYDVRGVQFHPESVMTAHGKKMLKNWLFNK